MTEFDCAWLSRLIWIWGREPRVLGGLGWLGVTHRHLLSYGRGDLFHDVILLLFQFYNLLFFWCEFRLHTRHCTIIGIANKAVNVLFAIILLLSLYILKSNVITESVYFLDWWGSVRFIINVSLNVCERRSTASCSRSCLFYILLCVAISLSSSPRSSCSAHILLLWSATA